LKLKELANEYKDTKGKKKVYQKIVTIFHLHY